MKVLIICKDTTTTAPGIVYKKIIKALSEYANCDIICPSFTKQLDNCVNRLPTCTFPKIRYGLEQILYNLFGTNIVDYIWSFFELIRISKFISDRDYDFVLSFVSTNNYAPLILGRAISSKTKRTWGIYAVDAIPSPLAWTTNPKQRKIVYHFLNKYIPKADLLLSANPSMLKYELKSFPKFKGVSSVVLTPCEELQDTLINTTHDDIVTFLYTGNIYGARKVDSLLAGFKHFYQNNPKSRLIFVGNIPSTCLAGYEDLAEIQIIQNHSYTTDLTKFYSYADVLIDIGSVFRDDVFLSSKISNYLQYGKIIIAITEEGSPAREMMSGVESIIHCHHNEEEVYNAMKKVAGLIEHPIVDRKDLIYNFLPGTVAKQLFEFLEGYKGNNKNV